MPMNMPSTACARHGALYVMVDTWAKVDAHALILALTLTLTLTPNAKHYPVGLGSRRFGVRSQGQAQGQD